MNYLEVEHLQKHFGDVQVLKDISFFVKPGEVVSIIGPSGSGKSTLLRCCTFLETLSSGKISYMDQLAVSAEDGKRPVYAPKTEFRKIQHYFGLVFQNFNLFPHYSVLRNITEAPRLILKKSRAEAEQTAMELLKKVGLADKAKAYPCELSGGQQQRVAIARALVNRPKILLLDEPLGALDLKLRKDMQTELRKIQQALELTFVYVTHDQEEALTMSDTVVVMNAGHIQQIGSPTDIYNEPKNAFVADFIGESNIVNGCMLRDCLVEFSGKRFECVDKGFGKNEMVDVVIRPEDIKVIPAEQAQLTGMVESVVFKGVHYEMTVDCIEHKWLIHSTKAEPVGTTIGMSVDPFDIHIMKKSKEEGAYPALIGVQNNEEA